MNFVMPVVMADSYMLDPDDHVEDCEPMMAWEWDVC